MIGVLANFPDPSVVEEFFELFKTPWEWYRNGKHYDVLLCAGEVELPAADADLVLSYAGRALRFDEEEIGIVSHGKASRVLQYNGCQLPIYGDCLTFQEGSDLVVDEGTSAPAICFQPSGTRTVARIGYDLFGEVHELLTVGQPASNAGIPTLELHIAILRDLIVMSGAPLAEVPPIPKGFRFIACLTHDLDHPLIRLHKCDHTMFGFLYRAVFGSLRRVWRKQLSLRNLLRNWLAAARLPLVLMGLAKDFWYDFDRYVRLEDGLPSTFFVIPFKGKQGRIEKGAAPRFRASGYGAADISAKIRKLMAEGREIGLHGIDAWLDGPSGYTEIEEIRRITGSQHMGARMHWLYFGEQSPNVLEQAGADYDSTIGYNETVGYRAGTGQAYKPMGAARLLELPLHIMDTALFYPACLNLPLVEAQKRVGDIIDNAIRFGGVVTINWHDRSISPERCWDDFYIELVRELKDRGAWFASASDTVAWFRQRRMVAFESNGSDTFAASIKDIGKHNERVPGLQLQVHNARQPQPAR